MQFGYTILYVQDVKSSLDFYEKAFGFKTKFLHEGGDFGELDTGATSLAFCSHTLLTQLGKNPAAPSAKSPCFEVAFTTPDVPAAVARAVAAGAPLVQAPEDMPWGQTVAYVADLNGFLVEICTPMGG
ncbi:MAG: VOC family protein [Rhodoferax sp.]|nr:VOC family protein [Rhodoferax sp.]MDP3655145.1 VOC family protein [Rhodoferax sp.]